jgi:hypothetical protein
MLIVIGLGLDSSSPQRTPNTDFNLLFLVDLSEDESHDVVVDDCADEGEYLYD